VAAANTTVAATVDPNAWHVLLNRNSGKVLDVNGAATADGAKLVQWSRTDATNQQFQFVDGGAGYYKVRARHSGKVLDVHGRSTADGAAVVQWSDNGGTNQQFSLTDAGNGYVRLVNRNSGKAVEVQSSSAADGATVDQRTDSNGTNQQWRLVLVDGGSTPPPPGSGPRQKVNFNREWRFVRSDVPGAQNPGFDDSTWVPVALPHASFTCPETITSVPVPAAPRASGTGTGQRQVASGCGSPGWTLRTVATILGNPRYTGRQVWNRQRTDHDSAAMGRKRAGQRWNQPGDWVISKVLAQTRESMAVHRLQAA
jgi:hypothetical protein